MTSVSATNRISRLYDDKPAFIYGTAWKKDQTKRLVKEALTVGFRRVDTAAQPRHYQEALVGEALREAFTKGLLKREELYLQTKYTTPAGQDLNNMPYDPNTPLDSQIHTSAESPDDSYVDCLLLHSPLPTIEQTIQAWKLLETYVPHRIRSLGISNVTLPVLQALYQNATVKPAAVQNRFYPQTRYDVPLRNFCKEHDIVYQSFWTLTGNPALLQSQPVAALARAAQVEIPVALYTLVIDQGVVVLNGSTSREHMEMDLEGVQKVRGWAVEKPQEFAAIAEDFKAIVG
ncbi:aldo-keto reductase-like protein [Bipolaris maydis]|nr:aldo-keto reductase-like protein [Bipolaris maydis]